MSAKQNEVDLSMRQPLNLKQNELDFRLNKIWADLKRWHIEADLRMRHTEAGFEHEVE